MPKTPQREAGTASAGLRPIVAGLLMAAMGVLALAQPAAASFWGELLVGLSAATAGVVRFVAALRETGARRLGGMALGAVFLLVGAAFAAHPILGTLVLTPLLAVLLVGAGGAQAFAALRARRGPRWPGLAAAAVSLGLAAAILGGYPGSSFWALGLVLGVELIAAGLAIAAVGVILRRSA